MLSTNATNPGAANDLIAYLWSRFEDHLQDLVEKRNTETPHKPLTPEKAKQTVLASTFVQWASEYLSKNRVVETMISRGECVVRLADNSLVQVCPGGDSHRDGWVDTSGAVPVIGSPERGNVDNRGAVPIT